MIILVDAAHDENGGDGYEGSMAGDQIGDEVRNIMYTKVANDWSSRPTKVYRCLRSDIREAYTIRAQQTADNSHVGYSQKFRTTYYVQLEVDPDPSHITVDCECDCSSLVNGVVHKTLETVNHPEKNKIYQYGRTADMERMYSACSLFENVTDRIDFKTGKGLQRGDIMFVPNWHTAIVWNVIDDPEPPKFDKYGEVTTGVYLRTEPSARAKKCNIQLVGEGIRNVLKRGERVPIIGESGSWYQVQIDGVYTWTPWVTKSAIKVIN